MKLTNASLVASLLIVLVACEIPVSIVGRGDILSRTGTRDCTYADKRGGVVECRHQYFMSVEDWVLINKGLLTPEPIQETYYAIPNRGQAVQSMSLSEKDPQSGNCRSANTSECVIDLSPAMVKVFVEKQTHLTLTTVFGPRTNQLTINGMVPKKIHASAKPQRVILKGQGFRYTDDVTLVDLSDPRTIHTVTPRKVDQSAGLMVIEYTFASAPSRWLLRVTRADQPESVAIPFDVIDEVDAIPLTDTVVVGGIEWVQPLSLHYLLYPAPRKLLKSACPQGVCTGSIKGYDLNGWQWATADDAVALFNHYESYPATGNGILTVSQANSTWAPALFRDFEYASYNVGTESQFYAIFATLYDPTVPSKSNQVGTLQIINEPAAANLDIFSTRGRISGACCNPPLLYRPAP